MALIRSLEDDRVKNLKSLSYGANQPLVTKDINKNPSPDGLGLEVSRRVDDLTRISKFFTTPSGFKFLGNQALLSSIGLKDRVEKRAQDKLKKRNARLDERGEDPVEGTRVGNLLRGGASVLEEAGKTALNTAAIIGSTLAQVPVNGTGTHFTIGFKRGDFPGIDNPNFKPTNDTSNLLLQTKASKKSITTVNPEPIKIKDFRKNYSSPNTGVNNRLYDLDYNLSTIKRESRVRLGDQGAPRTNFAAKGYTQPAEGPELDSINMLPPIKLNWDSRGRTNDEGDRELYDKEVLGVGKARDLIKFRFEVVTPDSSTILYFRAFLDTFNDNYQGSWSANNYLGRAEAFYTYQGFDRNISLGFKIAAATRHEMQPLYQKIVFLASSTAPTYSNNFMRGTLVKLTVGDYVYDMPGFIESVGYTWNTDYPWEIAMSKPEGLGQDKEMQELPQVLDVTVNFKPIHKFTPKTGLYHYITNPGFGASKRNLFFSQNNETKPKDSKDVVEVGEYPTKFRPIEQIDAMTEEAAEEFELEQSELLLDELDAIEAETDESFSPLSFNKVISKAEQELKEREARVNAGIVSSTTGNAIDPTSIRGR